MNWILISAIGFTFLSLYFMNRSKNNVCTTFEDYYTNRDENENCYYNPEYKLQAPDIIRRRGYPVETHHATTQDGYILTVFRIPHGRNFIGKKLRQPVFIQHGFEQNSGCFVNTGNKSLAFILADAGYDVWLGNLRGTMYSRSHLKLNDTDPEFWDYDINDEGIYDMPAQLHLVYGVTQQKIIYIGFSLGSSVGYIYSSVYPEIAQERIKILISLAPVVEVKQWNSATKYFFPIWPYVKSTVQWISNGAVTVRPFSFHYMRKSLCLPFPLQMNLCQFFDMFAWGFNYEQTDPETLPITLLHCTDTTSIRKLSHFIQIAQGGKYGRLNYGKDENMKMYGQSEPPLYNLSMVKVPVYLVRSENDLLATKENVEFLNASLPEEVKSYDIYVVKHKKFNHGDFLIARDVVPLLYNHLINFMKGL